MSELGISPAPSVAVLICQDCGQLDPGPRELCSACGSSRLVEQVVEGRGRLVSWTVIRRPPTKFRSEAPYAIAVVDLDAGVRITGRLGAVSDDLEPGAPVVLEETRDGIHVFKRDQ
ncbi:Zn-ribbon domain-containing OB-fold protein [Microvirga massiliensis]|uniref:Zn-ribbon domain-containing OB-fold protein n=1 Tax=Microvirga massiliensis TaxID=1033741 RepID=UPI00062B7D15|nr:OB-fold domain-containing protein [Microvirga massiliensis]